MGEGDPRGWRRVKSWWVVGKQLKIKNSFVPQINRRKMTVKEEEPKEDEEKHKEEGAIVKIQTREIKMDSQQSESFTK